MCKIVELVELRCNVDDMTGEAVAFAIDRLYEAGATDVYTVSVGMKKSRPGILINVTCKKEEKEKLIGVIFKYTTTIGVRESGIIGHAMERRIEEVQTVFGPVRRKVSFGYGIERAKYEFEDVARVARENGISFDEALLCIKNSEQA